MARSRWPSNPAERPRAYRARSGAGTDGCALRQRTADRGSVRPHAARATPRTPGRRDRRGMLHWEKTVTESFTLYGWEVSYYTGKVRSYLRFKGIPYTEIAPTLFDYYVTLRRRTGVVAIPVMRTPEGEWWQDSS